jgi:hypothetical protein
MITLKKPYLNVTPLRVIWMVANGSGRLEIPADCPEPFKVLLRRCWAAANDRPTFEDIIRELKAIQSNAAFLKEPSKNNTNLIEHL